MIIPDQALEHSSPTSTLSRSLKINDDPSSAAGDWSSIIGIVTAIVGNVIISFALNTQRYAHIRLEREQAEAEESYNLNKQSNGFDGRHQEPRRDYGTASSTNTRNGDHTSPNEVDDEDAETSALLSKDARNEQNGDGDDESSVPRKSYLRSPLWWTGIMLMTIGEAGNFLAYGFAPASIVSPLGVVALVSNCLIAPIFLHEPFRKRDFVGVLIAVGGTVTLVLSAASGSNPKLGPEEIWVMMREKVFLAYFGATVGAMAVLMILSNKKIAEKLILIDLGLVALFGGYTALSTKGVASMLSYTLFHALTFPLTYFLVFVLAATAVLQIKYVNRALQRFDSTQVIPTQFVLFTISVIVGSAVLYRDFQGLTAEKLGMFVGGCGLTFLGVWCLMSGRRSSDDNEESDRHEIDPNQIDEEAAETQQDGRSAGLPQTPIKNKTMQHLPPQPQSSLPNSAASTTTSSHLHAQSIPPRTPSPPSTPRASITPSTADSFATAASHRSSVSSTVSASTATPTPAPRNQPSTLHAMASSPLLPTSSLPTPSPSPAPRPNLQSTQTSTATSTAQHARPCRNPLPRRKISLLDNFKSADTLTPGPLTSPLSSGLSVVVADQRGRLKRGSSLRGVFDRVAGTNDRGKRRSVGAAEDERGGRDAASVRERPRVGRGATVEVARGGAEEDGGSEGSGKQRAREG